MAEKNGKALKTIGVIIAAIALIVNIIVPFVVWGKTADISKINGIEERLRAVEKSTAVTDAHYEEIIRRLDRIERNK